MHCQIGNLYLSRTFYVYCTQLAHEVDGTTNILFFYFLFFDSVKYILYRATLRNCTIRYLSLIQLLMSTLRNIMDYLDKNKRIWLD
jgi:hypothetical protein